MSQPHNVSPNITDPDLLPRKTVMTRPPSALSVPLKQENVMGSAMREPMIIQDNSFNRNLVIILVVLAVILILFLAYMYFYKGSDNAVGAGRGTPAIYGSPPGTTMPYPMGINQQPPVQMQDQSCMAPCVGSRQQSCVIPSRSKEKNIVQTKDTPATTHDKLKQELNSEDLRKELEDMNNRKTHDNYPSEHNKPQPSGVRFGYEDNDDDDNDNTDKPREYKALSSSGENFDDEDEKEVDRVTEITEIDSSKNIEPDIHADLSRFICGTKLKSCGFCKRKVTPGEKCTQHK
jgi:hypothetical protein